MENPWLHHLTIDKNFIENEKWLFRSKPRSFSKLSWSRFETHCFLLNDSFKQIFVVFPRGILVNNEVVSRLAIKQSGFCWRISLAKSYKSLILYLLEVKSLSIGTKNLAIISVGVSMVARIGWKVGKPSITFLWTFARL